MKDLGKGIATAGIWIGVGICGLGGVEDIAGVAFCAFGATFFLWLFG